MNLVPTSSIRKIAPRISFSKSSVYRLVKKKNLHCYKRLKTPQMNSAFPSILYHGSCFKMRRTFSFKYILLQNNRVCFNSPKKDVQLERLHNEGNKFSKKVMVSAVITWKGVRQPFFIGGNGIKVNGASYLKHLRDDLIHGVEAMYPNIYPKISHLFSFYEIIVPQFSCNQMKLDRKRKFEIIF